MDRVIDFLFIGSFMGVKDNVCDNNLYTPSSKPRLQETPLVLTLQII